MEDDENTETPTTTATRSTTRTSLNRGYSIDLVEFFSGIGGMRLGLEQALCRNAATTASTSTPAASSLAPPNRCKLDSCHAYEISLEANAVYRHNYCMAQQPQQQNINERVHNDSKQRQDARRFAVHTKLVEQLKPQHLYRLHDSNGTSPDKNEHSTLWTMSPPCQPFSSTRGGKLLDCDDKRCNGLKGILNLLSAISTNNKPRWIFLENVKGFHGSQMLNQVYACLQANGYTWKEYLVSPIQLGIPNHRLRYYLLCERSLRFSKDDEATSGTCFSTLPVTDSWNATKDSTTTATSAGHHPYQQRPLSDYLESLTLEESRPYLVPDTALQQHWAQNLSIATGASTQTYCFTSAYSRILHKATGSLVVVNHDDGENPSISRTDSLTDNDDLDNTDNTTMMQLYSNKLRRFTPRELLNLFGFPETFSFPPDTSLEHQYKLIGNSVNVSVVTLLLYELLFGE